MEGEGGLKEAEHDMVVLTVGFLPNLESLKLFKGSELEADEFAYIKEPDATVAAGPHQHRRLVCGRHRDRRARHSGHGSLHAAAPGGGYIGRQAAAYLWNRSARPRAVHARRTR